MLRFSCARCGAPLTASEERIGARVACPKCDHEQTISERPLIVGKPSVRSPPPLAAWIVGAIFLSLVTGGVVARRCNAPRVDDPEVVAARHARETLRAQIRLRKEAGHFERVEINEEFQMAIIWVGAKFRGVPQLAQRESLQLVRNYLAQIDERGKPIVIVRDIVTDEVTTEFDGLLQEQ